jgi:hypothetical protein
MIPSGKHTKNYGKSPFLMGKSTISMVIFNSYVKLPEGTSLDFQGAKFLNKPTCRVCGSLVFPPNQVWSTFHKLCQDDVSILQRNHIFHGVAPSHPMVSQGDVKELQERYGTIHTYKNDLHTIYVYIYIYYL